MLRDIDGSHPAFRPAILLRGKGAQDREILRGFLDGLLLYLHSQIQRFRFHHVTMLRMATAVNMIPNTIIAYPHLGKGSSMSANCAAFSFSTL